MKQNTRFNPTVNGPLHLGHVYTILVNQGEARASGGKFGVRFDDTQRPWIWKLGQEAVDRYREGMKEDLEWLGIQPDYYDSQAAMMEEVESLLKEFGYEPRPEMFRALPEADVVGSNHHFYPYTDRLTAEKVIMDYLEAVTWLIRGKELLTEDCLYQHYADRFEMWSPRRTYLPRLNTGGMDEISKTAGRLKIEEFRKARFDPTELVKLLAHDCVKAFAYEDLSQSSWRVEYVKDAPALGKWAEEALHGISA